MKDPGKWNGSTRLHYQNQGRKEGITMEGISMEGIISGYQAER